MKVRYYDGMKSIDLILKEEQAVQRCPFRTEQVNAFWCNKPEYCFYKDKTLVLHKNMEVACGYEQYKRRVKIETKGDAI